MCFIGLVQPLLFTNTIRVKRILSIFVLALLLHGEAWANSTLIKKSEVIDTHINTLMEKGKFPGVAVAVLKNGNPIFVKSYGLASIGHQIPTHRNTVFEIASLTKHMTALAIMTLIEEGKLSTDDKLVEFLDKAPADWGAITVNQLLANMAGFEHRFEPTHNNSLLLENSKKDMLDSALAIPLKSKPGSDWNYSDIGYFMLGVIIEKVTGKSFEQVLTERFFEPLNMNQTLLLNQRKIIPHLAQGYTWRDGKLERNRRVWEFELTSHFGVMSSLNDMIKWEKELATPSIINSKAFEATWEIQRTFSTKGACENWGYARGWQTIHTTDQRIISHGGYSGTAYIRAIDKGLSVIVLTNREDNNDLISPFAIGWYLANQFEPSIPESGYRCWE